MYLLPLNSLFDSLYLHKTSATVQNAEIVHIVRRYVILYVFRLCMMNDRFHCNASLVNFYNPVHRPWEP